MKNRIQIYLLDESGACGVCGVFEASALITVFDSEGSCTARACFYCVHDTRVHFRHPADPKGYPAKGCDCTREEIYPAVFVDKLLAAGYSSPTL